MTIFFMEVLSQSIVIRVPGGTFTGPYRDALGAFAGPPPDVSRRSRRPMQKPINAEE
jgi:hypothetical protein